MADKHIRSSGVATENEPFQDSFVVHTDTAPFPCSWKHLSALLTQKKLMQKWYHHSFICNQLDVVSQSSTQYTNLLIMVTQNNDTCRFEFSISVTNVLRVVFSLCRQQAYGRAHLRVLTCEKALPSDKISIAMDLGKLCSIWICLQEVIFVRFMTFSIGLGPVCVSMKLDPHVHWVLFRWFEPWSIHYV